MPTQIDQMTAVLLVGGFGTRLQTVVSDRPKPLASIAGRPFLSYQFDQLVRAGIKRAVLCTGYRGGQIESVYGSRYQDLVLEYSLEPEPLGTGGALRFALGRLPSSVLLVMNGDSYCEADVAALIQLHDERAAEFTLLLTHVPNTERFGQVEFDSRHRITSFREKASATGPGYINAGVYVVNRAILERIPEHQAISLEREVFPGLLGGGFYGLPSHSAFLDIGTPESYAQAEGFFTNLASSRA